MNKTKIKKNLSDADMFVGYEEPETFENVWEDTPVKPPVKSMKSVKKDEEGIGAFFTPELQEQVGKALLELKLELYKQGIIDYRLEVSREGNAVVLRGVNAVGKKKETSKETSKKNNKRR